MKNSYTTPNADSKATTGDPLKRDRSVMRWWVLLTMIFGGIGAAICGRALLRGNRAVENFSELPSAIEAMEAALPSVLAMLLAAIVTLVFAFRAKRRLKAIQEAEQGVRGNAG